MTKTYDTYLVLSSSRSYISGHFYFTNQMLDYYKGTPTTNGIILIESKNPKTVIYSSTESETGGTFKNAKNAIILRHILETVFLHQQHTKGYSIVLGNITPQGILNRFIKPFKSKTWDKRYHWLEDLIFKNKYNLYGNMEYTIGVITSLNIAPLNTTN